MDSSSQRSRGRVLGDYFDSLRQTPEIGYASRMNSVSKQRLKQFEDDLSNAYRNAPSYPIQIIPGFYRENLKPPGYFIKKWESTEGEIRFQFAMLEDDTSTHNWKDRENGGQSAKQKMRLMIRAYRKLGVIFPKPILEWYNYILKPFKAPV